MAKATEKAGKRTMAAARDPARVRKSGASQAPGTSRRKPKPAKLMSRKQKPSPALETAWLREQLKAARQQQKAIAEILRPVANTAGDVAHALPLVVENGQIHVVDLENPDPDDADWLGIKLAREAGTRVISRKVAQTKSGGRN